MRGIEIVPLGRKGGDPFLQAGRSGPRRIRGCVCSRAISASIGARRSSLRVEIEL